MKTGKKYYLKFYDHAQLDNVDVGELNKKPCIINLYGRIIDQDSEYWYVEVVNCDMKGNSLVWQVLKSTIIEHEELK